MTRQSAAAAERTSNSAIVAAALDYQRRGLAVIPMPAAAKNPGRTGWQRERYTAEEIPGAFAGAGGISILNGGPSGGVVDVDPDEPEAAAAWVHYRLETGRRHRRLTGHAHDWYVGDAAVQTEQLQDVDGAMLIELRSTGSQTVVPPSLHPSGERLAWIAEGDAAHVDVADLQRCVRHAGAAALLARHYVGEGSRHDYRLALAGYLLRGGLSPEDAERLTRVSAGIAGADEHDAVAAVRDTAAKLAKGERSTGGTRLTELLGVQGKEIVARLRDWLELKGAGVNDEPVPLDLFGAADLTGQPALDLDMVPPTIAAMAADESERLGVDPAMLALPALVVCAAALDDAHRIQPRRVDTGWTEAARLWLSLITPPGGRKTPALARVVAPLRAIEQTWIDADRAARTRYDIELRRYKKLLDAYVRTGIGAPPDEPSRPPLRRRIIADATIEALSEILADTGTAVLALYDELVAWIASHDCYRDRGGGRDRALWLSLYDGGPQIVDRVRRGHVAIPRWSACVLGASSRDRCGVWWAVSPTTA